MSEEYLKTLQAKIDQKIQEKLSIENEMESIQLVLISKEVERASLDGKVLHLTQLNQELTLKNDTLQKSIESLSKKVVELQEESRQMKDAVSDFDNLKIKLANIKKNIIDENLAFENAKNGEIEMAKNKDILVTELAKLRENEANLAKTIQVSHSKILTQEGQINGLLKQQETIEKHINFKQGELAQLNETWEDKMKAIADKKQEFIDNPLSIGFYIALLQKKIDRGDKFNVLHELQKYQK